MAKKKPIEAKPSGGIRETLRDVRPYVLPLLACTFAMLSGLVIHQRAERFVTEDSRFAMRKPDLGEPHSPDLVVSGIKRTSLAAVRQVFAEDEGRSIYLLPLSERHKKVTAIEWVKTASVHRLWPNRVAVSIEERKPVFLVNLIPERKGAPVRLRAVDESGRILPATGVPELASLPLMAGIQASLATDEIAARVRLMNRVIRELGTEGKPVSEIDVGDPDNIKLVYPVAGRPKAVTLFVGESQWRQRLLKFLHNWPEVEKRMPNAVKLDLRDDGIIGAMEFEETGEEQSGN